MELQMCTEERTAEREIQKAAVTLFSSILSAYLHYRVHCRLPTTLPDE